MNSSVLLGENVKDEWAFCLDVRRLGVNPFPLIWLPWSLKEAAVGEYAALCVGVGERYERLWACEGEPASVPDMADPGRYSELMVSDVELACLLSNHDDSGRAGERSGRVVARK